MISKTQNMIMGDEMEDKVDRAKELLRQLDRITDRAFVIKARKMLELQESLVETRKQLKISC